MSRWPTRLVATDIFCPHLEGCAARQQLMPEKQSTRPLGVVMIVAAWALVLALLTVYFNGFLDSERNPNRNVGGVVSKDGVREVRLKQNRQGHYVASGEINGRAVRFLLDTGATDVSVPATLADALNLRKGPPQQMITANGEITTFSTRLERVHLGKIVIRNVRAQINPHMDGDEVLLGMSFLRDLELVQREAELTLRQVP